MWSRALLAVITALLAAAVGVVPAAAHAELVGSSPADGAELTSVPSEVVLTFSEPLLDEGLAVAATDEAGTTTRLTRAAVDGTRVVVPWPESAPAGTWRLAYRVVADDGHPIDGVITFTITVASPTPTTRPPTVSPSPTPTTGPPTASPSPSPAAAATAGGSGWPTALVAAALALVAVAAAALVARRRRKVGQP